MRWFMAMVWVVLCVGAVTGEEIRWGKSWSEIEAAGRLENGEVVRPGKGKPFESLVVVNEEGKGRTVTVLTIERPGLTKTTYAVCGQIRHEDVEETGYLEMWSHFPDGGAYFTRTLAVSGAMGKLTGSGDWRAFRLPFFTGEASKLPAKLVINVVLPGKGKVELGPLSLAQYEEGEDPLAVGGPWWSTSVGGIIGGAFGIVFGCLGGVIGWLSHKGKARAFVMATVKTMFGVGTASLVLSVVALVCGQPYAVYYPPLLVGILLTILPLGLLGAVRKMYEQAELRKMEALDTP